MRQVTYKGLTFEPYIENATIRERIAEIANEIGKDIKSDNPLFICVLNGAFPFAADLFRAYEGNAEITFVRLSSYEGTSTTGNIKEIFGLTESIEGRDVILVEDIIDTGNTIVKLTNDLTAMNPASLHIATLLFKPDSLKVEVKPDYVGFEIPSKFIIGFGLDIDGMARNLPDIWVLSEDDDL